jgi:hypothetical protein
MADFVRGLSRIFNLEGGKRMKRQVFWVTSSVCILVLVLMAMQTAWADPGDQTSFAVVSSEPGISPPLSEIPPVTPLRGLRGPKYTLPWYPTPHIPIVSSGADPVLQGSQGSSLTTNSLYNFDGLSDSDQGSVSGYLVAPPDTNGAVGATQYVQWVNLAYAIYDKTNGSLVAGPFIGNTPWSGFSESLDGKNNPGALPCETSNSGDIIAQYDKDAGRWVMMQPVFSSPYYICVAVSAGDDARGPYYQYAFAVPGNYFPDYPKLGVWSDGYYLSYNQFTQKGRGYNFSFVGPAACAMDRTSMLNDEPATMKCFGLSSGYGTLLPSDLDGSTAPPSGSPAYFLNFDLSGNHLNLWKYHADFTSPSNSTLTGPTQISVASFSEACNGGTCIPQQGTKQKLDSLGDRLMYRLAYRNFSNDHEAMVVNHSVNTGSGNTGIRWYEIRLSGNGCSSYPCVYQQGTYAPDSNYRWMGSIAMDKVGNIALGYSVSSSSMHPAIRYTGRVPTDTLGTMESEVSIYAGTGSQTQNLSRWGDYSSMSIDPADDCTFWYTTEYLPSNGSFNWNTRIASFKFPSCQ